MCQTSRETSRQAARLAAAPRRAGVPRMNSRLGARAAMRYA